MRALLDKLNTTHSLCFDEYKQLLQNPEPQYAMELAKKANVYGNKVFIRGLIEISNICKNDCLYCGIRASNRDCKRYRLEKDDIISCCDIGYPLGFRTFVLQGGEDGYYTDDVVCDIVSKIKKKYPDCAVTLSLGERSKDSYKRLFDAGADRYLLRHETADKEHYQKLHPDKMSFEKRMECLYNLKSIGYQVGAGFMVGSPYQTVDTLAKDLEFIQDFSPNMCGIGPFIAHHATPFASFESGTLEKTLLMLAMVRMIHPHVLLPATTALGTIHDRGREMGILAGANVIMPNLSPAEDRLKYMLYDNKLSSGAEAAENKRDLERRMEDIGYRIVTARGDVKR
jgi:biotin synthase